MQKNELESLHENDIMEDIANDYSTHNFQINLSQESTQIP